MNTDALFEAVKEALRYAVLLAVSGFITFMLGKISKVQNPDISIILLTFLLKGLDKYLHQSSKEGVYSGKEPRGLLPF